ncbi:MAG: selenoneine biosynthesis selenosugar synthase SenB [Usitatibacter sp.]
MGSVAKPVVCIVTPGTRTANNGNWRTAARWAGMLRDRCRIIVQTEWDGSPADALIALHARRSAASIASFHEKRPGRPIAVVLTDTDLYKDLPGSAEAAASLDIADRIVALQEDAPNRLDPRWRRKTDVIYQSARTLAPQRKNRNRLDCVVVGHLREEKDPRTLFAALERIPGDIPLHIRHIGAPLDAALEREARELQRRDARYRYSGALPHGLARAAMKSAHVLVHPSVVEGGANVIVEALTAGTPVIASRISGNIGMLGRGYPGYFEPGDASGLASRLVEAWRDPRYLVRLARECNGRRKLFTHGAEARAVRKLLAKLLAQARR